MQILVVDTDRKLSQELTSFFEHEGFATTCAHDGERGLQLARRGQFDLMILELVLPRLGGLQLLRQLRVDSNLPVLMLSNRAEDVDRIVGLELGADDYVAKPVNPRELVARIRAIARRTISPAEQLAINGVVLRPVSRSVTCNRRPVSLTTVEFDILEKLMRAAGRVVSREELSGLRNGESSNQFDRSIDMHISRIRRKLGGPEAPVRIKTIHRVGYQFLREEPAEQTYTA